jgi:hypothetical protein
LMKFDERKLGTANNNAESDELQQQIHHKQNQIGARKKKMTKVKVSFAISGSVAADQEGATEFRGLRNRGNCESLLLPSLFRSSASFCSCFESEFKFSNFEESFSKIKCRFVFNIKKDL